MLFALAYIESPCPSLHLSLSYSYFLYHVCLGCVERASCVRVNFAVFCFFIAKQIWKCVCKCVTTSPHPSLAFLPRQALSVCPCVPLSICLSHVLHCLFAYARRKVLKTHLIKLKLLAKWLGWVWHWLGEGEAGVMWPRSKSQVEARDEDSAEAQAEGWRSWRQVIF